MEKIKQTKLQSLNQLLLSESTRKSSSDNSPKSPEYKTKDI